MNDLPTSPLDLLAECQQVIATALTELIVLNPRLTAASRSNNEELIRRLKIAHDRVRAMLEESRRTGDLSA